MGYTMATAVCNKCGASHMIIERHGAYKPGTTVNMWCTCAKTPDDRFAHTPHTIADRNDRPPRMPMLTADVPWADVHADSGNDGPTKRPMVTAVCCDCGHKAQLIQPAKPQAGGTKIGHLCWACPERDDDGMAIRHPHTVMAGNEDPTYPLMTATCGECGHERRFMDAYECEPGTRLTLDCQNRDAGHFWKNRPHTVVTIGATA